MWHVAWSGAAAVGASLEVPAALAQCLCLPAGITVSVRLPGGTWGDCPRKQLTLFATTGFWASIQQSSCLVGPHVHRGGLLADHSKALDSKGQPLDHVWVLLSAAYGLHTCSLGRCLRSSVMPDAARRGCVSR